MNKSSLVIASSAVWTPLAYLKGYVVKRTKANILATWVYTNLCALTQIYTLEQTSRRWNEDHIIIAIASCLKAWSSHRKMWKDNLSKIIYIFILLKDCASVLERSSTFQNSLSFAQKGGVPCFYRWIYTWLKIMRKCEYYYSRWRNNCHFCTFAKQMFFVL